jgi:hypothetical protein
MATHHIPIKIRKKIVGVFAFLIAILFLYWVSRYGTPLPFTLSSTQCYVIGLVLLILLIVFSVDNSLRPIEINRVAWSLYIIPSILIIVSGFNHNIGDGMVMNFFIIIFVFPALGFVLRNSGKIEELFKLLSWCVILSGIIFFILCVFFDPLGDITDRYQGVTNNPNTLGIFAVMMLMSALYILAVGKGMQLILSAIGLLLSLGMLILSESRTSIIIGIISLVISAFYITKSKLNQYKSTKRGRNRILAQMIQQIALILLVCIFCISLPAAILKIDPLNSLTEATEPTQQVQKTSYIVPPSTQSKSNDVVIIKLALKDRTTTEEKTLDKFSSGRISLWKEIFSELNFSGHDVDEEPFVLNGKIFTDAHLVPLTVAYLSGIPAGIMYLLLEIYFLYIGIRCLIRRKENGHVALFICLSVCAYFIFSSLEVMRLPLSASVIFFFFITTSLLLFRNTDTRVNSKS